MTTISHLPGLIHGFRNFLSMEIVDFKLKDFRGICRNTVVSVMTLVTVRQEGVHLV